jgi:hypothetical protein
VRFIDLSDKEGNDEEGDYGIKQRGIYEETHGGHE